MRAIWSGSITFGLISIPIKLYTAVGRKDSISLHLLHEKDGEQIHYKRVCEKGHEVDWDDIIKGYEYKKGRWVTFTDEELDSLETESVRAVDVQSFVPAEQIDPIYFDKTYYIGPEEGGTKAYRLLVEALEDEGLVGVSKVAIREKEHLAAIRITDGEMILHTMHWPEEIRDRDFKTPSKRIKVNDRERKMARQLIRQLAGDFEPDQFEDELHKAMKKLVKRKVEGKDVVVPEPVEEEAAPGVVDLMEALKRSVAAAKAGRKPERKTTKRAASGNGSSKKKISASDLESLSKEELYEKAKELDIPGRTKMAKKELIKAISQAA